MSSSYRTHGSGSKAQLDPHSTSQSRSGTTKSTSNSKGGRTDRPRLRHEERIRIIRPVEGEHFARYNSRQEAYQISKKWGASHSAAFDVSINYRLPEAGVLYNTNVVFHVPVAITDWRDRSTSEQFTQILLAQGYSPSKARVRTIETFDLWKKKVLKAAALADSDPEPSRPPRRTWLSRVRQLLGKRDSGKRKHTRGKQ